MCPSCRSGLGLEATPRERGRRRCRVGRLICTGCGKDYRVFATFLFEARLIPQRNYSSLTRSRSNGQNTRGRSTTAARELASRESDSSGRTGWPKQMKGELILEWEAAPGDSPNRRRHRRDGAVHRQQPSGRRQLCFERSEGQRPHSPGGPLQHAFPGVLLRSSSSVSASSSTLQTRRTRADSDRESGQTGAYVALTSIARFRDSRVYYSRSIWRDG